MRKDNRYVFELPSGKIKNPQLKTAGDDLMVNDVVSINIGIVMPMFDETVKMYGVVAADAKKGDEVLIAAV